MMFVILIYNIWVSQYSTTGFSSFVFINIQDIGLQNREVFNFPKFQFFKCGVSECMFFFAVQNLQFSASYIV